jgi:hypothetical protein
MHAGASAFGKHVGKTVLTVARASRSGCSLAKISALTFENACFGHGGPILGGADKQFRRLWPTKDLVARR